MRHAVITALSVLALALVVAAGVAARKSRPGTTHPGVTARGAVLLVLAVLTAAAPLALRQSGATQAIVGAVVVLLAPGAAVVGFAAVRDPLTELVLSLAVSLTVLVLLSQLMLLLDAWDPRTLFALLAVVAAPFLTWHGVRDAGRATAPARSDDALA